MFTSPNSEKDPELFCPRKKDELETFYFKTISDESLRYSFNKLPVSALRKL